MSRGFACTLAGIAVSIFAWFSPWLWPGLPAVAVMQLVTRYTDIDEQRYRSLIFITLLVLNVATWALVAYALTRAAARLRHAK